MKSRISLCNGTILKKDLTRFAPVMLVVSLILWIVGASMKVALDEMVRGGYTEKIETGTVALALISFLAVISAINFFTYLTKKGECDAMHALPLRRDTLFFTKIIAAFLQFAIPFGVFFAFLPGDRGWLFQMTVSTCAWLFCYGLAVLSMMLVGRRLAGFLLYSLLIDSPSTIYMLIENLYLPRLPGVVLGGSYADFSPTTIMIGLDLEEGSLGEILLPMGGFALLGVVFLMLGLVAYRRRKLERAGDFLAVKWLEPVFAWALGIIVALVSTAIVELLDGSFWFGLVLGLTIGYFAARMFFARTIKVFGKGDLIGWAALVAVMAVSLFVTELDPLGLVTRVPAAEKVESVTLYNYEYLYLNEIDYEDYNLEGCGYTATDPAEIGDLRAMHRSLIEKGEPEATPAEQLLNRFYLVYELKDGSQMVRTYNILEGDELKKAEYYLSQPENLVGSADIEEVLMNISELYAYGVNGGTVHAERAFLRVFLEECEAGLMYSAGSGEQSSWQIRFLSETSGYHTVDIPLTAGKTIAWLEEYFKK